MFINKSHINQLSDKLNIKFLQILIVVIIMIREIIQNHLYMIQYFRLILIQVIDYGICSNGKNLVPILQLKTWMKMVQINHENDFFLLIKNQLYIKYIMNFYLLIMKLRLVKS